MTRRRLILLVTLAGIVLICLVAVSVTFFSRRATLASIESQREQWEAQGIDHYAITVERTALTRCQQRLEVITGESVTVLESDCPSPPFPQATVESMFDVIDLYADHPECNRFAGCRCPSLGVAVKYDPAHHYPESLRFVETPPTGIWRVLPVVCSVSRPAAYADILVIGFQPLP